MRLLASAALIIAAPVAAQNSGLPSQQQSAVLVELFAERGEDCDLLRPWQAAGLRMQTRELIASFDDAERAAVALEIEARRPAMGCDDELLNSWITAARPNFEREHLPELLAGYRAFALQDEPPEAFSSITNRDDYSTPLGQIDAKLAQLEADGVRPPGGMTWSALHVRQADAAAQITAILAGVTAEGRFTLEQARQLAADVAQIGELWLAEP